MTALVGIMNKRAAVIAADSAVTVTKDGKTKIYNTETKVFQVSNYPVGVMIYSDVEFMGTPWDLILKLFRKKCGDKEHKFIKDYAEDLISFLRDNDFFCDKNVQEEHLTNAFVGYFYRVMDLAQYYSVQDGASENQPPAKEHIHRAILRITEASRQAECCPEWDNYSFDRFASSTKDAFEGLTDFLTKRGAPADMNEAWIEGFYEYFRSSDLDDYTGLVFVGYGSKDIFPSLIEVRISGVYEGRLRYWVGDIEQIDANNSATICPFGQKDVIHSLLKGLRPDLHDYVLDTLESTLDGFKNEIVDALNESGASAKSIDAVLSKDIDKAFEYFAEQLRDKIQKSSVAGVVDAVECFNIDDMAKMAESLISVTNLSLIHI